MKKMMSLIMLAATVAVLTGCDCDCGEKGTLMLRGSDGGYDPVCRGVYTWHNSRTLFRCDDGRIIHQPVNFIIEK